MQVAQHNGIGALLAISVGICAFGGWLYACYPETALTLANDSRQSWSFLLLLGFVVVAVIGVAVAGSVLQHVMVLLRSLVQLSLIVAVVAAGIIFVRRDTAATPQRSVTSPQQPHSIRQLEQTQPVSTQGKWWERKK
jgi:hypothetical protein